MPGQARPNGEQPTLRVASPVVKGAFGLLVAPVRDEPLPDYSMPISPSLQSIRSVQRLLTIAGCATIAACATPGGRTSGATLPIDVQVNNNLRLPADLSVYAVSQGGHRTLLGDVPPATNRTLRFKPVAFSEPYRLLAIQPNGRQIVSQSFIVGSDMTGGIIWTLTPNIVGFEGVDPDSATTP